MILGLTICSLVIFIIMVLLIISIEKTKKEFDFEGGYKDGSNNNEQDYYAKLPKQSK